MIEKVVDIKDASLTCSFCGKDSKEVAQLVASAAGPSICDECLTQSVELIGGMRPANIAFRQAFETLWRVAGTNVLLEENLTSVQERCTALKNENRALTRQLGYIESRVKDYPILEILLKEARSS